MQNASEVSGARSQLVEDFRKIVSDSEALLRAIGSVPGDKARELRASVEENLSGAKERLRELQAAAMERGTAAARATDEYVHENPWALIAGAAAVGFLVGLLVNNNRQE
jgi:ElaB/YqjD/DUF883 family membrane-anchored ribosome-binding protein